MWLTMAGAILVWAGAFSLAAQGQRTSPPATQTRPATPRPGAWCRAASREWPAYGGGPQQIRYSPLTQINRTNVTQLAVAWTYDTGEPGAMQTQPVVVDGVLYGYTPTHKTFALKAGDRASLWTFDSGHPRAAGRTAA